MKTRTKLTLEQKAAKRALEVLLANQREADRRYDELPQTFNGRIISTDAARYLDARYRDTPAGRPRDLLPSWDLAWQYAQDRLRRELSRAGRRRSIRFMAGGWGAGKTRALEGASAAALAWDGTLASPAWAQKMIDLALANGWNVEVAYVFRDIEMAIYGAMERAREEGRSVPIEELPGNHLEVQLSIRRILKRYRTTRSVSFLLLHNTGSKEIEGNAREFHETELARGGALHYSLRYEAYYAQVARELEALRPA